MHEQILLAVGEVCRWLTYNPCACCRTLGGLWVVPKPDRLTCNTQASHHTKLLRTNMQPLMRQGALKSTEPPSLTTNVHAPPLTPPSLGWYCVIVT